MTEKARRASLADVSLADVGNEEVLFGELSGFADESSILWSTGQADDSVFSDSQVNSVTDASVVNLQRKRKCETPISKAYNTCGRRFEKGIGQSNIRNELIQFKPVSTILNLRLHTSQVIQICYLGVQFGDHGL